MTDKLEIEIEVGDAICHDCGETSGETHADDVGRWVAYDHPHCDVDVKYWTHTYTPTCAVPNCDRDAVKWWDVGPPHGDVPVCDVHPGDR